MSRNKLSDLNDYLFAQIERFGDADEVDEKALKLEIDRAKAIEGLGKQILSVAKLSLDAEKLKMQFSEKGQQYANPKMLE